MKIIELDEDLYQYIAAQTQSVSESTSDILRRLLLSSPLPSVQTARYSTKNINQPLNDNGIKSMVDNWGVLEMQNVETSEKDTNFESSLQTYASPQSEAIIQQTVNKVRQLLNSVDFQQESTAVSRFLALLTVLYRNNSDSFAQAIAQEASQGRSRTYFAQDEETLLAAGNHTKPKPIPDTPYWVITNTNSARKMLMLERTMQFMQLPESLIDEIRTYFTAD